MDGPANSDRRTSISGERLKPAPSLTKPVTFKYEIQNHTTRIQKLTHAFQVYRLMVLTLICVVAGIIIGLMCRPRAQNWSERQFMYIELPGELYLRFLKLMIMPLLVSNVILSFGTIQGKLSSHLGKISSFLYLGSNGVAIAVAIILALLISPGRPRISQNGSPNSGGAAKYGAPQDKDYLNEQYHDSIKRYREYHPMSYHTVSRSGHTGAGAIVHAQLMAGGDNSSRFVMEADAGAGAISLDIDLQEEQLLKSSPLEAAPKQPDEDQSDDHLVMLASSGGGGGHLPMMNFQPDYPAGDGAGAGTQQRLYRDSISAKLPVDVLLDVLRNLVPDSIVGATMQQVRTRLFVPRELKLGKNGSTDPPPSRWPVGHEMVDQPNIVGLLAISIMIGVILSHMDEASKPVLDLCSCISELSLRVGMIAIHLTPFCIMFLLIGQVARSRSLTFIASELCMYSITVIVALLIHGLLLLPLAYYVISKKSPVKFFINMLEALVAAFATSSSSATMALVLNCLTEAGLNPVIVRAFGPLGSVFNMNGTAIYEAIGAIFIAQTLGVTLPLMSLLLVGFSSAVAGLSTTGIPSSGMMTMVIVLNAVNLPVLQLSLIYIVDFIIDRFRTVVNVWSGAIVCGLIDHICPEHLFEEEMKPEKYREILAKMRGSRGTLGGRRSSAMEENAKPQVISVTITPPSDVSHI